MDKDSYFLNRECVAYLRRSTDRQNFSRQHFIIDNFAESKGARMVRWFEETISGGTLAKDRPIFLDACRYCNENGYTLLVSSVDRLCRNIDFPILFSEMEERGDFDINIICEYASKGYASIEELGLSVLILKENINII